MNPILSMLEEDKKNDNINIDKAIIELQERIKQLMNIKQENKKGNYKVKQIY